MSIYATPLDNASIKSVMQRASTKIHVLMFELKATQKMFSQIADEDLKDMIAVGESLDPILNASQINTIFTAIRDWQAHINKLADNYEGNGTVADISYHVEKRVVL